MKGTREILAHKNCVGKPAFSDQVTKNKKPKGEGKRT